VREKSVDERVELTSRGESSRERILRSAAAVLAASGYAGATLTEIATRADTKAGSLYHYFDSRESLIREVMTRGITETISHAEAALVATPTTATSRDRLSAVIRAHVEYVLSGSDIARASIRVLGQAPPEVQGPAIELHRQYGAMLSTLISAAARDGYLAADVDERLLRLLIAGAVNWSTAWFDPAGPSSATEVAEALVKLVFGSPPLAMTQPVPSFNTLHARRRRT
jgi:TetR/AcrR family transcriptional regulator, cholesterol catabolism regulator